VGLAIGRHFTVAAAQEGDGAFDHVIDARARHADLGRVVETGTRNDELPHELGTPRRQRQRHRADQCCDPERVPQRPPLGSASPSAYAAPARAEDLSGLPAACIATAEFDPSRGEAIEYALRLLQAGVSVELHQWPGTFHGSQAILSAKVSQRQIANPRSPAPCPDK
jgi:acetyl esterase/lipase